MIKFERLKAENNQTLLSADIQSLPLVHKGKVREIYNLNAEDYLIIATDRVSAFDVIMQQGIYNKGKVLTQLSNYWFKKFSRVIPNHLSTDKNSLEQLTQDEQSRINQRYQIVKKLKPLKIEAVVRGYVFGSGWKEYQNRGSICGVQLPSNLQFAERLPQPIFTPTTKAKVGDHDENINLDEVEDLIGIRLANSVKNIALKLYTQAYNYAKARGIIIADTKFEFGIDTNNNLYLIDEILTPDSSRFWEENLYQSSFKTHQSPPSLDKQILRDYLESTTWNKSPPSPLIPANVLTETATRYQEVYKRLVQEDF